MAFFMQRARLALFRRGREPRLRVCLQRRDMGAQGGGRRDARNGADLVAPAPVEHLGAAIMAAGAQCDRGLGPVRPDRPRQAAQEGADFRAFGPLGRAQHGRGEAALAVEDDDGLEPVFVVMRPDDCRAIALN